MYVSKSTSEEDIPLTDTAASWVLARASVETANVGKSFIIREDGRGTRPAKLRNRGLTWAVG